MHEARPILFYDGECGFCHRSVRWAMRHDRRGDLRFAPLQGETYRGLDVAGKPTDVSSMVVAERGRLYVRSGASVRMLRAMGGVWAWLGVLVWMVPRPVRDWGYRFIARRRQRLGGPGAACAMPTEAERARMLP